MRPSGACEEGGFPHADRATAFDVYEIPWDGSTPVTAAQLSRAEIAPLLDPLEGAGVSFRGLEQAVPQEEIVRQLKGTMASKFVYEAAVPTAPVVEETATEEAPAAEASAEAPAEDTPAEAE